RARREKDRGAGHRSASRPHADTGELDPEIVALVQPEENARHADLPGRLDMGVEVVHEHTVAGRYPEPLGGHHVDGRLGLGHAHLRRADDVVEEMVDGHLALEAVAQRAVGIAQHPELVRGAQVTDEAQVGLDGTLRPAPLIVQTWERVAGTLLERPVRFLEPGLTVAPAPLDVSPCVAAVEGVEHGRARQPVRLVEGAGDIPAHVPENATEVEDDAAQVSTCCPSGERGWTAPWWPDRHRPRGGASPCPSGTSRRATASSVCTRHG